MQASIQVVDDLVFGSQGLILVKILVQRKEVLLHGLLAKILLSHVLVDAFYFGFEFFIVGLHAIQFVEELLVLEECIVVLVEAVFGLDDLIIQPYLLICLSSEPTMDALIILGQFVLLLNQPIIHFIQSVHEFEVCLFD